ncbi:MAG TPA: hypothetical protein VGT98_14180 [Candidatus Elarobacter sp.]|nr:hypothetical protein [Candidatus Elarobacter sp.]
MLPAESSTFRSWSDSEPGSWALDAVGRRYVHRDGPYASHLARFRAAAQAVDPAYADLDLEHWRSIRVASRKLGLPREMILAGAPTVPYRFVKRARFTTFVWTGPPVRAELAHRVLAAAAREHGLGGADEFHTIAEIRAHFGYLGVSFHALRARRTMFRGVIVTAPVEHRREERGRYFHVPATIWTSEDAATVRFWAEQHGKPSRRQPRGPSNLGDPLIG